METWTSIRALHAQGVAIRAICRDLGVSRKAVRHALRGDDAPHYQRPHRPNPQLVPFEAQLRTMVFSEQLIGSRIDRELRKVGYTGSSSALYAYLKTLRAALPSGKATVRYETPPGRQAQFDWSPYTVDLGGALTKLIVFGMTLGYSRRKHYTASLDETQASILEAIERCLHHFGGAPKELLVDNARALVTDAHAARFRWNAQFLELCGHYRLTPRACVPYRPRTKGKIERPFFYLEQQFVKGTRFASFSDFQQQLATFEAEDLDQRIHTTTQERPIDRFAAEVPHLTPLPEQRFVGTLALSRKVSWDCLISFRGSRYSVPAVYAGKLVWLLLSRGTHLLVLDGQRQVIAEHTLSPTRGVTVLIQDHYAALRTTVAHTYGVLAAQFLARFPQQQPFLDGLVAQHKLNPAQHLRPILALAEVYDAASLARALALAVTYNTYSPVFVRGLLEGDGGSTTTTACATLSAEPSPSPSARVVPSTLVRTDLAAYQRILEVVG